MARSGRPSGWSWVYDPAGAFRRSKKPLPADLQHEVERRAQELTDSTLKSRYLQPPPKHREFNYLVDFYARWRGPFFYFCSRYGSPGPRAPSPFFESKFARFQCAGDQRFNLSYFRHTGQCWQIAQLLSREECLSEIKAGGLFTPYQRSQSSKPFPTCHLGSPDGYVTQRQSCAHLWEKI